MLIKRGLLSLIAAVAIAISPTPGKEDPIPPPGRRCFEHYEYVTQNFNTPSRMAKFLDNYVSYQSDQWFLTKDPVSGWPAINPGDYLKTPFQTFRTGFGDCEDYSYLASDLLKRNGYDTRIIGYVTSVPGQGHAVCVVKEKDSYSCVDQRRFFSGFKTIEGLVGHLNPDWQMIFLVRHDSRSILNMSKEAMYLRKDGRAILPVFYK